MSDEDEAAELLDDVDVRAVSIIWVQDDDRPEVTVSGCSVYEAIGMTLVATLRLVFAEAADDEEDEDE